MASSPTGAASLRLAGNNSDITRVSRSSRFVKGTNIEKPPNYEGQGICVMLWHPMSILLVFLPLGYASPWLGWGHNTTFWLNFTALVPLAKILGDATEELAAGLKNDMLAGMLNATFGNAVEVVMMAQTLRAGMIDVVKATLLGSVLSNLLLVLGCSFFFGGLVQHLDVGKKQRSSIFSPTPVRASIQALNLSPEDLKEMQAEMTITQTMSLSVVGEKVQTFSVMSAMVNTSMLLLACLSLSLVTVFHDECRDGSENEMDSILLPVSRTCSVIIMLAYCAYIFFQLVTHRDAMSEDDSGEDDEDAEEPTITVTMSITVMFCVTLLVAFSSELLVESLETVVGTMKISSHFIGIIMLPIVGNACEHASAIRFAIQDKPGLSIGIAVGSSTQISMFVVPFSVLMGWFINQPMELDFGSLNTTVLLISVVVVLSVVVDGNANWLQGYLLVSAYFVIAVLYWHLPDSMAEAV